VNVRLAPSILSADFAALGDAIAAAERGGADLIHVDVMDGHFVPNITIGPPVVRSIKRVATVPLDVHLMIEDPDRYIGAFVEAGAAMISVHAEVLPHLHRTVHAVKALGARAGVVLNPSTPVAMLEEIAGDVDFVLVMSVNPGFGGQSFIPRSEQKVSAVRALLDRSGNSAPVEIDGGIDRGNIARVVRAGAEIIVAGSAVFHTGDPERATRELKSAALAAIPSPESPRGRTSARASTAVDRTGSGGDADAAGRRALRPSSRR
jgi:ribulose-phosphate 3-epimerase